MLRSDVRGVLCVTVCLTMASAAWAQGQGGRGGRGGFGGFGGGGAGASTLLRSEQVQKELKITDEQKGKLDALREEARGGGGGGRGGFQNLQNASDEEREKIVAEMRKRAEERDKKAEAVLNPEQTKRLKEISLQVREQVGESGIADPEIGKELKLTDDQKASVKTIQDESRKQMQGLRGQGGGDREERMKKMTEIRKATNEEYLAILTDDQKAQFAAMKGAKFEIDLASLFQGGPGGRGGRRGGNNN